MCCRLLLFLSAVACFLCFGCESGGLPENSALKELLPDDPPTAAARRDLRTARDFEFGWQESAGWPRRVEHAQTLRLAADGTGTYTAAPRDVEVTLPDRYGKLVTGMMAERRQITFKVPPETVRRLRELLSNVDFLSLGRRYSGTRRDEAGYYVRLEIRAGGTEKRVECKEDYFPQALRRIAAFVHKELTGPQAAAVATGRVLDWEEAPGLLFSVGPSFPAARRSVVSSLACPAASHESGVPCSPPPRRRRCWCAWG
jgi:hypothetical protein